MKGPVSAIHHCNGDLIVCLGSKIMVYSFEDEDNPQPISFLDAQIFVNMISTLKEYVLIGDICKSVWFLRSKVRIVFDHVSSNDLLMFH
jgi:cleavage and polyadenylation specificity factor subunit 1